jgi:glucose-6-phosphate isomerase
MATLMTPLAQRSAWKALEAHRDKARGLHLRKLFEDDPTRGQRLTVEALGLYFDYSKNRITDETLKLLLQLATESGLRAGGSNWARYWPSALRRNLRVRPSPSSVMTVRRII